MNSILESTINTSIVSSRADCSPFLNWDEKARQSESERTVVFRSLVATVKSNPAVDASLEAKAVRFLKFMIRDVEESADPFLSTLERTTDESLTDFVQSIMVLVSSPSRVIASPAMKILNNLIFWCSPCISFTLIKADLIPELINTLNPLSLSFSESVDIHTCLLKINFNSLWFATPRGLASLKIEDPNEQQAVHETILKQVLAPSEKYIWHLCVNRFSIIDGEQSINFLRVLATLLHISPYHQQTMDFVLNMPVFLTIPSFLTFFEDDCSIRYFLNVMIDAQLEWNKQGRDVRQMWKKAHRMLRMEGLEDAMEEKLQNDKNGSNGRWLVAYSMDWNSQQGMNLPRRR
ncbi:hypothetical protein BLNAU_14332 [Blattamonas nauphoetae]|uniref:Uncharacterized protein n=1 Tax=Blattamonas nauphoetae TaxID=2049346 RepID=A0ABQ9XDX8_9EUKA|nr:hypothetical protein BLNAU_14332 [Blattamonas nauphoetae]